MVLLVAVFLIILVVLVVVAMNNDDMEAWTGCRDDIPCQECGKCYKEHPASFANHSYVMPKDDLR